MHVSIINEHGYLSERNETEETFFFMILFVEIE